MRTVIVWTWLLWIVVPAHSEILEIGLRPLRSELREENDRHCRVLNEANEQHLKAVEGIRAKVIDEYTRAISRLKTLPGSPHDKEIAVLGERLERIEKANVLDFAKAFLVGSSAPIASIGVTKDEVSNSGRPHAGVYVWKILESFSPSSSYRISIKHAAPGEDGAFHITLWADTDGDGVPDNEFASSPLLASEKSGDWSTWEFEVDSKGRFDALFVGWSLPVPRTMFYQSGGDIQGYRGLSTDLYYARQRPGDNPRPIGRRYGNVRVDVFKGGEADRPREP